MQLISSLQKVQAKLRSELEGYEPEEREKRLWAVTHREEVEAIDDLLAQSPTLSPAAVRSVQEFRSTCEHLAKMHESVLREKRYTFTEQESADRDRLHADWQKSIRRIGSLADGKAS